MTITLKDGPFWTFLVESETGQSLFVQEDWDFPRLAGAFGWAACPCGHTDGTVECDHRAVRDMIWDAYDYLSNKVGETIEDPGYF